MAAICLGLNVLTLIQVSKRESWDQTLSQSKHTTVVCFDIMDWHLGTQELRGHFYIVVCNIRVWLFAALEINVLINKIHNLPDSESSENGSL